jgi:hypothetical protein
MKLKDWGPEDVIGAFISAALIGMVSAIGFMGCMWAKSDGRVNYCYITEDEAIYRVVGHRNWRPDVTLATALTAEDAKSKMALVCPSDKETR